MKNVNSVLDILNSVCNATYSRTELNYLIQVAQKFAINYLRFHYKNQYKNLLSEDVTLSELSIDAIAPLFERNEKGRFVKLETIFNNWQPQIETEAQAVFFLNKISAKSVEQYIGNILRNSDPFFSKILDSITYICSKQNIYKKQIFGTTYLVEDENDLKIGMLPDNTFIENLPSEFFYEINKTISKIFEHIKSETDKAVAIPLNSLVLKIKHVRAVSVDIQESVQPNLDFEINTIVENALNSTFDKLRDSYAKKGKLSEQEIFRIEQALNNIATDMQDGGVNIGLHKYLLDQFENASYEEYKLKYQNIFEYLFKILKKEIACQVNEYQRQE